MIRRKQTDSINAYDLIEKHVDPIVFQSHGMSKKDILTMISNEYAEDRIQIFAFDDIVVLGVQENPYVMRVHVISESQTPLTSMEKFAKEILEKTSIKKLYGFTSDERLVNVCRRYGKTWRPERGHIKGLHFDADGNPLDVYVIGAHDRANDSRW